MNQGHVLMKVTAEGLNSSGIAISISLLRADLMGFAALNSSSLCYSGLMFAAFISGHHFSISAFW